MITVYTNEEYNYILDSFFSVLGVPYSIIQKSDVKTPKVFLLDKTEIPIDYKKFKQLNEQLTGLLEKKYPKDDMGRVLFNVPIDKPLFEITLKEFFEKLRQISDYNNVPIIRKCTWPENKPFAVCLTHDIDHVKPNVKAYLAFIKAFLKKKKIKESLRWGLYLLTRKNPWGIDKILSLEKQKKVKSTFFFLVARKHKKDTTSNPRDIENAIKTLVQENYDVQLHGSFTSFDDKSQLAKEKSFLESIKQDKVEGIRQHYLRFDNPKTFRTQEKIGLKFDSTYGVPHQAGYRAGIGFPFHPYDSATHKKFRLLEIPLILMDVTLIEYMRLPQDKAWTRVKELLELTESQETLFTVLWHNTYFDNTLKEWRVIYEKIIKFATEQNAFIGTAKQIYEWWSKREKATIKQVHFSEDKLTWEIGGFEGLCVKLYLPKGWRIEGINKTGKEIVIPVDTPTKITVVKKTS